MYSLDEKSPKYEQEKKDWKNFNRPKGNKRVCI